MDKWSAIFILGVVAILWSPLVVMHANKPCKCPQEEILRAQNDSLQLNLDECVERYDEAVEALTAFSK